MAYRLHAKQLASLPATGGKIKGETCDSPYSDGGGLYFVVAPTGDRSFMFRWTDRNTGKRPEFTFAGFPGMSLDDARIQASKCRNEVKQGRDPRALFRTDQSLMTLGELIDDALPTWAAGRAPRWTEDWKRMQRDLAKLMKLPVATITHAQVLATIKPIWAVKPLRGEKYLAMLSKAFRLACSPTRNLRVLANPAQWKDGLANELPKARDVYFNLKGERMGSRKSLPFHKLPDFMKKLSYDDTVAARAVEFAILCGGRSQEARLAEWSMIDFENKQFNVPARLMKGRIKHTVLLCDEAIALLKSLPRVSKYIFPSEYNATCRDEAVLAGTMLYRVRKIANVDVHGFRATIRNFAGAETDADFETCEQVLAHLIGNDTTRAYFKDPLYKKRAKLMAEWGAFAMSARPKTPVAPTSDNVVAFKAA